MLKPKDKRVVLSNGNILKTRREELLLSMKELAKLAGVSVATVRKAEKGKKPLLVDYLRCLAKALGLPTKMVIANADDADEPTKHRKYLLAWTVIADYETLTQFPELIALMSKVKEIAGTEFFPEIISIKKGSVIFTVAMIAADIERFLKVYYEGKLKPLGIDNVIIKGKIRPDDMPKDRESQIKAGILRLSLGWKAPPATTPDIASRAYNILVSGHASTPQEALHKAEKEMTR